MPTIDDYIQINPLDLNNNIAIGVSLAFGGDAVFNSTFTQQEQVKSNILNVLLTEKGERVFEPKFGVGLRNLLFESQIDERGLEERINVQVKRYVPTVTLNEVTTEFKPDEHILSISLEYTYNPSQEIDAIQLNFNAQQ